jgi:hypothetical protein
MSFLYWHDHKQLWLADWEKLNPNSLDDIIEEVEECWLKHQNTSPEIKEHLEEIRKILRSTKNLLESK